MSQMTFGRIGVAVANGGTGYVMQPPTRWSQSGADVALSGVQRSASISTEERAKLLAWRDAMLGYDPSINQGDEPVVSVTVADVSQVNGWYKVRQVSVDTEPGSIGTAGSPGFLWLRWSVSLEALDQTVQPLFESSVVNGVRPNSQGVVSAGSYQRIGIPVGSQGVLTASSSLLGVTLNPLSIGNDYKGTTLTTSGGDVYEYLFNNTFTSYRFAWKANLYSTGAAAIEETVNADLPVSWTWNDVSGSLTWNAVAPALTWDDVLYDGVS